MLFVISSAYFHSHSISVKVALYFWILLLLAFATSAFFKSPFPFNFLKCHYIYTFHIVFTIVMYFQHCNPSI